MTDGHRALNRRTATLLLGSATLFPIASLISNAAEIRTIQLSAFENIILSLFEDPHKVQSLGLDCMDQLLFSENSLSELEAALLSACTNSFEECRLLIRNLIRREFFDDEVVFVNGWILSITEARLYAFVARHIQRQHGAPFCGSSGLASA